MNNAPDLPISFPNLGIDAIDPIRSFSIGPIDIHLYGVIIAFGLILAAVYGMKRSRQFGVTQDDIIDGLLWIVPVSVLCARLYYCAFSWDSYKDNLWSILRIWEGGLAIYGGVIGAALGIAVYAKCKKLSLPALLDLVAIGFLIGQSIGRWGNFFNREAFGCYSDNILAMRVAEGVLNVPADASEEFHILLETLKQKAIEGGYVGFYQVHPTFLYESVWNAVGFVLLHFLSKKRKYDGQVALGYLAWYGLGRTFIEGLRMDSLYWGPFRVSQVLAAITCFIGATILIINLFRPHDPQKLFVNRRKAQQDE